MPGRILDKRRSEGEVVVDGVDTQNDIVTRNETLKHRVKTRQAGAKMEGTLFLREIQDFVSFARDTTGADKQKRARDPAPL